MLSCTQLAFKTNTPNSELGHTETTVLSALIALFFWSSFMALFVYTHRWWIGSRDAELRSENLTVIETQRSLQNRVSGTNKNTCLVKAAWWAFVIVLTLASVSFGVISDLIVDGVVLGQNSHLIKLLLIETVVMSCFALTVVALFYVAIFN